MSFVRPEAKALFVQWSEVIAALALLAFGIWVASAPNGPILSFVGYAIIAVAALCLAPAYRRARFTSDGTGAGVVTVDEGQISYLGPVTGGVMALADLQVLTIRRDRRGVAAWVLTNQDALIVIPANAVGAEALFDAFATLPGINLDRLLSALKNPAKGSQILWSKRTHSALTGGPPRATSGGHL